MVTPATRCCPYVRVPNPKQQTATILRAVAQAHSVPGLRVRAVRVAFSTPSPPQCNAWAGGCQTTEVFHLTEVSTREQLHAGWFRPMHRSGYYAATCAVRDLLGTVPQRHGRSESQTPWLIHESAGGRPSFGLTSGGILCFLIPTKFLGGLTSCLAWFDQRSGGLTSSLVEFDQRFGVARPRVWKDLVIPRSTSVPVKPRMTSTLWSNICQAAEACHWAA